MTIALIIGFSLGGPAIVCGLITAGNLLFRK